MNQPVQNPLGGRQAHGIPHSSHILGASPLPRHGALLGWGIALLVIGPLTIGLALMIVAIPLGLFVLGGGGNVDAFDDFASGFLLVAGVIGLLGLAMVAGAITMLVVRGRKRKAAAPQSQG